MVPMPLCRAPLMFAALLRRAGANAQLLPLLSEPASAAVRGLSITARRARPAATVAFLQVAVPGCLKHQCCPCWEDSCGNGDTAPHADV